MEVKNNNFVVLGRVIMLKKKYFLMFGTAKQLL